MRRAIEARAELLEEMLQAEQVEDVAAAPSGGRPLALPSQGPVLVGLLGLSLLILN